MMMSRLTLPGTRAQEPHGPRFQPRARVAAGLLVPLAAAAAALVAAATWAGEDGAAPVAKKAVVVREFSRTTIYHSPQKPGYTSWVGAWEMPDKSLMVCFTQVTGPAKGRSPAPAALREKLGIPEG